MKKIAILIADLFDDKELLVPYYRCLEEGFKVDLVGAEKDTVYKSKFGLPMKSDVASRDISAHSYNAVIIPGGFSPDYMRRSNETIQFVKDMDFMAKPIAAICHGPWMMASSCDLKGKRLTGFFSIKDDLVNAGAHYVDEEVVVDGHLITSRTPNDLPAFMKAIIKAVKS
ncbi:type 1 glutamine amidotransferase domain-containing protein [Peloplasma aerotolerans]|jgi:protease I|uniref:Type 1 glutamine amidotransferase domain-containing protein n=1 Tax=Peloplasma aerotolerans TaxID=3044389 RepID=A0AAW6UA22_9MOLU|nr:type 1 glutamine amidotransferase domain-containing protein [Mariniplasma sp. M4Ah]MDI6453730.1 type 1 glutamine amidotransferase domain-containing protein [Mariniplasma sp. M4Ah]